MTLNFLISPDMEDRSNAQTAKKGPVSLVQTVQAIVEDAQRAERYHTASNYRTAVRSLLVYIGADDLDMQTLNSEVIESYQRWLRNSNVKLNTISCYARALRAIYNKVKNRLDSEEDLLLMRLHRYLTHRGNALLKPMICDDCAICG